MDCDERMETPEPPDCFGDLFLDQIIDAVTASKEQYNLKPFFYTPLHNVETIRYRHEVMRDLEDITLRESIKAFAEKMVFMRRYLSLAEKVEFKYYQEGWFLEAVEVYCQAVADLARDLNQAHLESRSLQAFREYLMCYVQSDYLASLVAEMRELRAALSAVKYSVVIKGLNVRVRKYAGEPDYTIEVEKTFERFKQGAVKDYRVKVYEQSGMNHVEAKILDCVAKLYPDTFAALDSFYTRHSHFLDGTIQTFDREIQFYIAYLEHIAGLRQAGLRFCYPEVTTTSKDVYNYDGFDLALAHKLLSEGSTVVCNDFYLKGNERIIIVSGPNQGGKTTFARTFGQLHFLASLGCPVPGSQARLFMFDRIFTHFEREENIQKLHGKLQDDLVRMSEILTQATPNSIIIINEIFTSTTLEDAVFLGKKVIDRINRLDLLCVCVTFLDELASLNDKTVSMVSTVAPENPALRTFKIVRRPADGLAYAISIAEKYRVTYDSLKERIKL
jgi:DNA mismatch repair ATPase MutS